MSNITITGLPNIAVVDDGTLFAVEESAVTQNASALQIKTYLAATFAKGPIAFLPLITALTGDTSATLDGMPTAGLAVKTVYGIINAGQLQWWQLQAGAAGANQVQPADYNAGTNSVKWVQVG